MMELIISIFLYNRTLNKEYKSITVVKLLYSLFTILIVGNTNSNTVKILYLNMYINKFF